MESKTVIRHGKWWNINCLSLHMEAGKIEMKQIKNTGIHRQCYYYYFLIVSRIRRAAIKLSQLTLSSRQARGSHAFLTFITVLFICCQGCCREAWMSLLDPVQWVQSNLKVTNSMPNTDNCMTQSHSKTIGGMLLTLHGSAIQGFHFYGTSLKQVYCMCQFVEQLNCYRGRINNAGAMLSCMGRREVGTRGLWSGKVLWRLGLLSEPLNTGRTRAAASPSVVRQPKSPCM